MSSKTKKTNTTKAVSKPVEKPAKAKTASKPVAKPTKAKEAVKTTRKTKVITDSDRINDCIVSFLTKHEVDPELIESWRTERGSLDAVLNQLKKKRTKKLKDPNAPKKAAPPYFIFCKEYRARVVEENPDLKSTEIMSKLGAMWKELSEKEKKRYKELNEVDKQRYAKEMESYVPSPGFPQIKKKKDPSEKRPHSAYILYCNDTRESLKKSKPDLKPNEVMSELGKSWRGLSEKKKKVYTDRALKLKEEFEKRNSAKKEPSDEEEEEDPSEEEIEDESEE